MGRYLAKKTKKGVRLKLGEPKKRSRKKKKQQEDD